MTKDSQKTGFLPHLGLRTNILPAEIKKNHPEGY